jgi:hypothetical protein
MRIRITLMRIWINNTALNTDDLSDLEVLVVYSSGVFLLDRDQWYILPLSFRLPAEPTFTKYSMCTLIFK